MEKEKLFVRFLALAQMYYRENNDIDFYAERAGITSGELQLLLEEAGDKSFEDWLEVFRTAQ